MYVPQNYEHVYENLVVPVRQIDNIGLSHMDTSMQSNDWANRRAKDVSDTCHFLLYLLIVSQ